ELSAPDSHSMNQRRPSDPAEKLPGTNPAVGSANTSITPSGVTRPSKPENGAREPARAQNHMFPSGPGAIAPRDHEESTGHLASSPEVVIRPIQFAGESAEF